MNSMDLIGLEIPKMAKMNCKLQTIGSKLNHKADLILLELDYSFFLLNTE